MKKNKGTNQQQHPDSSTHDTSANFQPVPSFNLLGLTVPEKSVTKILMFENWRERKMKK